MSGTIELDGVTLCLAAGLAQLVIALQAGRVDLARDAKLVVVAAGRKKLFVRVSVELSLLLFRESVRRCLGFRRLTFEAVCRSQILHLFDVNFRRRPNVRLANPGRMNEVVVSELFRILPNLVSVFVILIAKLKLLDDISEIEERRTFCDHFSEIEIGLDLQKVVQHLEEVAADERCRTGVEVDEVEVLDADTPNWRIDSGKESRIG